MIALRSAEQDDEPFLWEILALAAHEPDAETARAIPFVADHLAGWRRPSDFGVIAVEEDGTLVGATWARHYASHENPAFFFGEQVPEVTIAVLPGRRGSGIGSALLDELAGEARSRGLAGLSLNVRHDNPARRLYERAGFQVVPGASVTNRVGGRSIGMLRDL